jgi:three-Cys-motif partner protein
MAKSSQRFGNSWTDKKLAMLAKYLPAYTTALKKQPFRLAYIDAFAGTGYRTLKSEPSGSELMFPELADREAQQFLKGSAKIALETNPPFDKYIFIEKDAEKVVELAALKEEFPDKAHKIEIVNADANEYLYERCTKFDWSKNRAVLFLDPFGMEVNWETIQAISNTKAIDLWLLFPLGVAVSRLLRKDAKIDKANREKLNRFFGSEEWFEAFYKPSDTSSSLFSQEGSGIVKAANFEAIEKYFILRLKKTFAGVAENPYRMYNSKNNPLYLLCFAASNQKGAKVAIKIAQHILGST